MRDINRRFYREARKTPYFSYGWCQNSAVYAMQMFQQEILGEAEKDELNSDDDIMVQLKALRNEGKMYENIRGRV